MEFGIFSQMHVPPGEDEHSRFMREVDVAIATDAAGFKYNWAPEHHFLEVDATATSLKVRAVRRDGSTLEAVDVPVRAPAPR